MKAAREPVDGRDLGVPPLVPPVTFMYLGGDMDVLDPTAELVTVRGAGAVACTGGNVEIL